MGIRLTSEPLDISSRTVVVVPPKPGVVFSTVKKPGVPEQFTFIVLIDYGRRLTSYATSGLVQQRTPPTRLEALGSWGQAAPDIVLNGKPIEVGYRVELDASRSAVKTESLMIDGHEVDILDGQVVLVDLTEEEPVYRQVKVELPTPPVEFETEEDAERAVASIVRYLEHRSPEIKAYLR